MRKLSSFDQFLRVLISATLFVSCTPEEQLEEDPSTETPSVSAPSALYVEYSKDTNSETTVTVAGVASGQTVTLYSDSGCQTHVAQGTASATSISFNVTGLSAGSYTYYAKARSGSDESDCSTASITYEVASCPTGYVKVPANPSRGVPPFCVMQFEAKDVGGVPTSQAALTPWMNLSANSAKSECQSLNSGGSTAYDLISNQEWMTIAENAQGVAANWNNGNMSSNMNYGNSNNENQPMAVADTEDPWSGVTLGSNPTTNFDYRRTHVLSNGVVLWDLAGNAGEIVDYSTGSSYTAAPTCTGGGTDHRSGKELRDNNYCPALGTTHYMPVNENHIFSSQTIGSVSTFTDAGRTLTRGGSHSFMNRAGVLGMHYSTNDPGTATGTHVGFRCVYRLNPVVSMSTPWAKNFDTTPDITVSGVQYGYTVNLYTDSSCSTQVASKVSTGSSVTLTTSALAVGTHNFYFKVTNRSNVTSACSTTFIPYEVFSCPTNYLAISGSTTRGVNPFCVMKYEARTPGGNISNYPTTSTDGGTAKSTCITYNSGGPTKYNLISNLEWMTIADNIAAVAANWSSGTVGSGFINRGNTENTNVLPINDESNHWNLVTSQMTPTTDFNYRRTHYLTSGEVIWDIGGNASEIVDYGTGATGGSFQMGPACTQGDGTSVQELSAIQSGNACTALATTHYLPAVSSYGSAQGAGVFIPRQSNSVLVRGGNDSMGNDAGIYGLSMPTSPTSSSIGYRCVYRP